MTTPAPADHSDVLIIGGGIAGVTAAYFLARLGGSVRLLEKSTVSSHQSSRNWGFVRRQGCDPLELPLAQKSSLAWRALKESIGDPLTLARAGLVNLAANETMLGQYRQWVAATGADGVAGTQILGPDEIRKLLPGVTGPWTGAMYTPEDGHAEPGKATRAIAAAAKELGARIDEHVTVQAICVSGGRVTGVDTSAGTMRAGTVVCAAGAWSSRLLRPLGIRLPVRWIRATAARTTPAPPLTDLAVATPGVGFSQAADGRVTFGSAAWSDYDIGIGTLGNLRLFLPNFARNRKMIKLHLNRVLLEDVARRLPGRLDGSAAFDWPRMDNPPPNRTKIEGAFRTLRGIVPELAGTRIETAWAGTVDVTPDALPVIGHVDGVPGLVLATGLSSHGFGIGPGVGQAVSELIRDGAASIDLAPFRVGRFAEGPVRAHNHL